MKETKCRADKFKSGNDEYNLDVYSIWGKGEDKERVAMAGRNRIKTFRKLEHRLKASLGAKCLRTKFLM